MGIIKRIQVETAPRYGGRRDYDRYDRGYDRYDRGYDRGYDRYDRGYGRSRGKWNPTIFLSNTAIFGSKVTKQSGF